jgi:hypothetical protein
MQDQETNIGYKIFPASPEVLAKCDQNKLYVGITDRKLSRWQSKYPFAELLVGECFIVTEFKPNTLSNLRSLASIQGKRYSKKFKVVIHKEYKCVEIARLA